MAPGRSGEGSRKPAPKKAPAKGAAGKKPASKRSAPRKTKPRPGSGRGSLLGGLLPRLAWLAGFLAVVAGVGLAWWWEGNAPSPPDVPAAPPAGATLPMPPPYEEPPGPGPGPHDLRAVDEALFAGLRLAGLEPAQVRLKVQLTAQGEVAVLEAVLPPGKEPQAVRLSLERELGRTPARAQWRTEPTGLVLSVSLADQATHLLRLIQPAQPRPGPPSPVPAPEPRPLGRPAGAKPQVAIVIDDLGHQLEPARRLLGLGLPLTMAILPHSPHGPEIAQEALAKGLEVMVHLPMEARANSTNQLGKGALLTSLSAAELSRVTLEDLRSVPGAVGANNHMGSRFTEQPAALGPVLAALREQGLFFLDSVTSPRTQAFAQARGMGLRAAQRDIFLDHDHSRAAIDLQLQRLLKVAADQGRAIAIGHPHGTTIESLAAHAARLRQAVDLVPVSALMEDPAPTRAAGQPNGPGGGGGELDRAGRAP